MDAFESLGSVWIEKRKKNENHISDEQPWGCSHVAEDTEPKELSGA